MLSYQEPSITELHSSVFTDNDVRILVLHEYQNNESVSGNKWWKLRDNLILAKGTEHKTVLSFGGAYSNHIYALAAAAKQEGLKSIGIIRGENVVNPTLEFARSRGMELIFVSREDYRKKEEKDFQKSLIDRFGPHYLIPEGGTNEVAIETCRQWGGRLGTIEFDRLYMAVGSGGSISGIIDGLAGQRAVTGIPVLKNTGFLDEFIARNVRHNNWSLVNDYHFGGYAKVTKELTDFCTWFEKEFDILIEPTYTGKLFFGVIDQIKRGLVEKGSTIIAVHSGGLQARLGQLPKQVLEDIR